MLEQSSIGKSLLKSLLQPLALGSFKNWLRLLKENKHIDPRFLGRALYVSMVSFFTGPMRMYQRLKYRDTFGNVRIRKAPVFILGHWRSGTTHLHNLMCQDPRLGYVSALQVIAPDFFYVASDAFKKFLRSGTPGTRLIDNMSWSIDGPQEEEMALGNMSPYSLYHFWSFPQNAKRYFDRYAIFKDATCEEIDIWKEKYLDVLKMATFNMRGRRLVIKNPANTGRIPILLELFPDAKFVFLHRDPYRVFLSTRNLHEKTYEYSALQEISHEEIENNILKFYEEVMRHYLKDRSLIPPENLVEIGYDELDQTPMQVLKKIYNGLKLPSFSKAKRPVRRYLKLQKGYQKNSYKISVSDITKVNQNWGFAFDEWGYSMRIPE